MLNPDGVFLGHYRSNAFGYDLNRFWAAPHPTLHPEVAAARALLLRLQQHPRPHAAPEAHAAAEARGATAAYAPSGPSTANPMHPNPAGASGAATAAQFDGGASGGSGSAPAAASEFGTLDFFVDVHAHSAAASAFM